MGNCKRQLWSNCFNTNKKIIKKNFKITTLSFGSVVFYLYLCINNLKQNKMKQTSVEWLEELIECGADLEQIKKCLPKAKEMEKQEKIDFANNYGFDICGYDYERAEQYYETFKTE